MGAAAVRADVCFPSAVHGKLRYCAACLCNPAGSGYLDCQVGCL